jgi:large subunit ribosomal protein L24
MNAMTIKKGDQVQIIAGKDRGKRGTVERVLPKEQKVVVAGLNIVKRHLKPSKSQPRGGIIEKPAPIHRSNVMPVCPETSKPTRVRHITTDAGVKYRSSQYGDISLDSK